MTISAEQVNQYHNEGYAVLESVIPPEHLEALRAEAQHHIDLIHAEMDAAQSDTLGISHRHKRYFISLKHPHSEALQKFLFSDFMADVTQAILGKNVYLFYEQYVIKAAEKGMKFGWHQDSGFVDFKHNPYLSCWCALDDMTEENGTIYVLPYSRAGSRELVAHVKEEGSNDKIGYHGTDPGIPVIVPAGSIALFSSLTFHRSGVNTASKMRRSYLAQYSPEPMGNTDKSKGTVTLAVPFIKNGQSIYTSEVTTTT
jgi:ectoine hydroxylase-related dioxygenase (phytanoyl-CoA dioxygenase family)